MKPDMSPDTVNTRPLDRAPDLVTNGQMRVWAAACCGVAVRPVCHGARVGDRGVKIASGDSPYDRAGSGAVALSELGVGCPHQTDTNRTYKPASYPHTPVRHTSNQQPGWYTAVSARKSVDLVGVR